MPSCAPRRRAPAARPALALAVALGASGLAACSPALRMPRLTPPGDQRGVIACAAEVAELDGLAVLERGRDSTGARLRVGSPEALQPERHTADARAPEAPEAAAAPAVDVVTVAFGQAGVQRGLRVAAQSFHLLRDAGSRAVRWLPVRPSARAVEARDHILARCSTLGG